MVLDGEALHAIELDFRSDHVSPHPRQRIEDRKGVCAAAAVDGPSDVVQRTVSNVRAQFERLAVRVHEVDKRYLVVGPRDRVVVLAAEELPPGFVQGLLWIPRAEEAGDGCELLRVEERVLAEPVGDLEVDARDRGCRMIQRHVA